MLFCLQIIKSFLPCVLHQENQDQLLHRVSGFRRPAGVGVGDAVWCHRAGPPALDLRRDFLPGPDLAGCPAHHCVHTAPVLHRPGQVRFLVFMHLCVGLICHERLNLQKYKREK